MDRISSSFLRGVVLSQIYFRPVGWPNHMVIYSIETDALEKVVIAKHTCERARQIH